MGLSFDILIFDCLLKPPQPVTGLFFKRYIPSVMSVDPKPMPTQCRNEYDIKNAVSILEHVFTNLYWLIERDCSFACLLKKFALHEVM